MFFAVRLARCLFNEVVICIQSSKDGLGDILLLLCRSAAKVVKTDLKPFIDVVVNLIVLVA